MSVSSVNELNKTNSFYRFGGIEILNIEQDAKSFLYKIKLATPEHYVVSREFDRSVGMFGNAPDDIVRNALMDFSDTITGNAFSIYAIMDMFIDRCFSEAAFYGSMPEKALWLSSTFPTYEMAEELLNGFGYRLVWFDNESEQHDIVDTAIYRTYSIESDNDNLKKLSNVMSANKITAIAIDSDDNLSNRLVQSNAFSDFSVFKTTYRSNGVFNSFQYVPH
jgi:hypothetical protein